LEGWQGLRVTPRPSCLTGERKGTRYLAACSQPWKDAVTLILGRGLRPGEVFKLRWEHILLNGHGGLMQIAEGKSRAARRVLPMVPAVYAMMKVRHEAQLCPAEGWVFPTGSICGHLEQGTAKTQHARALANLAKARKEKPNTNPDARLFEPYCLRHTALTWIAKETRCDAWTMAKIAGHRSIVMTQRFIHPQADAIERVFSQMATNRQEVVTDGGHSENALKDGCEKTAPTVCAKRDYGEP
jgi:integrase